MTTISVTNENGDVQKFDFDAGVSKITIGRRTANDVCISHLSVSGKHACITLDSDGVMIEDLNSTNGTYLNGRMISRQKLSNGDQVIIGKTTLKYQALELAPAEAVEAAPAIEAVNTIEDTPVLETADAVEEIPVLETASTGESQNTGFTRLTGNGLNSRVNATADEDIDEENLTLSQKAKLALGNDRNQVRKPVIHREANTAVADPASSFSGEQKLVHELDTPANAAPASAVIEIKNGAKSGQVLPIDKPVTTLGRPGIQIAAIMRKPDGYFLMHIESDDSVELPTLNEDNIGDEPVLLHSGDTLNVAGIEVEFMLS